MSLLVESVLLELASEQQRQEQRECQREAKEKPKRSDAIGTPRRRPAFNFATWPARTLLKG